MAQENQREKAERFRQLHHGPGILVLANAWDAASARLFEAAGFPAVATTSAGLAKRTWLPDGEFIPREEMFFMVRRIVQTVQIPVTVDAEAGFGASIQEVVETVRGVLAAGAIGINLQDRAHGQDGLADIQEQVEKIQALRRLADEAGVPLVINARTDAFAPTLALSSTPLEETVRRANAYHEAGADCAFVPFVTEAATIQALTQAIDGPVNILATVGTPPVAELERLGVARVSVGSGPHRATMGLTRRIGRCCARTASIKPSSMGPFLLRRRTSSFNPRGETRH
jgi:2-methylisocitrate lyase-like PEP mutase family enzyme